MGIIWLFEIGSTVKPTHVSFHIKFTASYIPLSLALNIMTTILIVLRLLYYRRHARRSLGPCHATLYTDLSTMVIESAVLYSTFSVLFLIPFALNNPIQNFFLQLLGEIQVNDYSLSCDLNRLNSLSRRLLQRYWSFSVWCRTKPTFMRLQWPGCLPYTLLTPLDYRLTIRAWWEFYIKLTMRGGLTRRRQRPLWLGNYPLMLHAQPEIPMVGI